MTQECGFLQRHRHAMEGMADAAKLKVDLRRNGQLNLQPYIGLLHK